MLQQKGGVTAGVKNPCESKKSWSLQHSGAAGPPCCAWDTPPPPPAPTPCFGHWKSCIQGNSSVPSELSLGSSVGSSHGGLLLIFHTIFSNVASSMFLHHPKVDPFLISPDLNNDTPCIYCWNLLSDSLPLEYKPHKAWYLVHHCYVLPTKKVGAQSMFFKELIKMNGKVILAKMNPTSTTFIQNLLFCKYYAQQQNLKSE